MGKLKLKGKNLGNICVILLVVMGIYYIVYHTDLFRLNLVEGLEEPKQKPKKKSKQKENFAEPEAEAEAEPEADSELSEAKPKGVIKAKSKKEHFTNISPAPVGGPAPCVNPLLPYAQNNCGPVDINQFFFDEIQFKPECCPSTYSSSMGCACMCPEQLKYLNSRGGNRTHPSLY